MEFTEWLRAAGTVFGVSMLPIFELKAAIPLGLAMGLPLWETFIIALLGSTVPVPLLLFFLRPVFAWMRKIKLFRRFVEWVEARTHRKSASVKKYRLLGLFIFVAIPLPTTGVWTGSAIASFLDIRIAHALPAIFFGNVVAGLLMLLFGIIVI